MRARPFHRQESSENSPPGRIVGTSARSSGLPAKGRVLATLAALIAAFGLASCRPTSSRFVVVYTSQDQVYAEPILRAFTAESGIDVRAVYDSEVVKTVGLANRLLAEKSNPQGDVFWSNEELRTRQLVARGVLENWAEIGGTRHACRLRQIVVNTNRVTIDRAPASLAELTNTVWRGRVALAYPLFGTTATHFLALRQHWGEATWLAWCRALQANEPLVVDGNSVVVQLVGRGEAWIGLTDSDDIHAGRRDGLPIRGVAPAETLRIPNTVARVTGCPRAPAAASLIEYLQRDAIADELIGAGALDPQPSRGSQTGTGGIRPDWDGLLGDLDAATDQLKAIFLR